MEEKQKNKINKLTESGIYARFYSFFLLPLMMVLLGTFFYVFIGYTTSEDETFSKLMADINNGSNSKRWHAAFRLGKQLSVNPNFISKSNEKKFLISSYQRAINYEKSINNNYKDKYKLRMYLIMAMGNTMDDYYGDVLLEALDSDADAIRFAAIQSLGKMQYRQSSEKITSFIKCCHYDKENDIEVHAAVISIGQMRNPDYIPLLIDMLDHEYPNIRWEAAVALARMDESSGKEIVNNLLDRSYYRDYKDKIYDGEKFITDEDKVIIVAIDVASELKDPIFEDNLNRLASNYESNTGIRNAAKQTLKKIEEAESG